MDSLLFLIKKHNNNKLQWQTSITFINKNE